jgi:regulator of sirC expression with transglutaminase-like and TPR domain
MLRIAPDAAPLWREAALINQRLERVGAAVRCYERFLDFVPQGDTALRTRAAIDELRSRLN